LKQGLVRRAKPGNHTALAVVEIAAKGDHHEDKKRRNKGKIWSKSEHKRIRIVRYQVFLEEQLDAVRQGLKNAERASDVGAQAVLHSRDDLPLEPDHRHH
jgi:hypothetical protein